MARRLAVALAIVATLALGGVGLVSVMERNATVFEVAGDRLRIEGAITGASAERFERLLAQTPRLSVVVLGDIPGTNDVSWLLQMGTMLRASGLDTRAEGTLINDAILLFAAGVTREIGEFGRLQLTGPAAAREAGWPLEDGAAARAERADYARRMLGRPDWAEFAADIRETRDLHELSPAEIALFGLQTGP